VFLAVAFDVGTSGGSRWTVTFRLVLLSYASGRLGAAVFVTDSSAHSVEAIAGLVVGTVLVVLTDTRDASNQRVTLHSGWTLTGSSVVLDQTFSTAAAALVDTRVETVFVDASLVVWTVVVGGAFGFVTVDLRVAAPTVWTDTGGSMKTCPALGVCSARIRHDARVLATLVDARLVVGTFIV
jgi:hypothetical protein